MQDLLLVIAYPRWEADAYERIQAFRSLHDALYYQVVEPHFTLVFPVAGMGEEAFIADVAARAVNVAPIRFHLRCATVNKDGFAPVYHTLLVPDEGYSSLVRLHDRLYAGALRPHLRLDIDFIPHVGIANDADPERVKVWADAWNDEPFTLSGRIDRLDVITYRHPEVLTIATVALTGTR